MPFVYDGKGAFHEGSLGVGVADDVECYVGSHQLNALQQKGIGKSHLLAFVDVELYVANRL